MNPALPIALVGAQRLGELVLARRNERALRARGAVEHAPEHYPLIVALHAAWLAALVATARSRRPVQTGWLWAYAALQGLRAWTLLTLGRRWTTRVLTFPGERPVTGGPFRYLRHPNYAVVAGEIAVLPMALRAPGLALLFSALNAAVLAVRIRAENRAWAQRIS